MKVDKTISIALTENEHKQIIMKLQEREKPGERISRSNFLRTVILESLGIEKDKDEI